MNLGGDTLQPLTARLSPHMGRPSVVDCEAYPMWEAFLVKKKCARELSYWCLAVSLRSCVLAMSAVRTSCFL